MKDYEGSQNGTVPRVFAIFTFMVTFNYTYSL
jgi:hypothetical protein